jgi:hypothetical protein
VAKSSVPWWWTYPWYEHQNLRDERAEAFTSLLWNGVYDDVYYARAGIGLYNHFGNRLPIVAYHLSPIHSYPDW